MTLKAQLQFGDNVSGIYSRTYRLVNSHHGVKRDYNSFAPLNGVKPKDIEVTVVASDVEDFTLHNWYISNDKRSGRLCFIIQDVKTGGWINRSLPFEDAQCVSFKETYDTSRKLRRHITICFTPARIKIETTSFFRTEKAKDTGTTSADDDSDVDMDKYNSQFDF